MSVAPESSRNRIMIFGPKTGGTYVVEFGQPRARHWRSAYRLERLVCSKTSEHHIARLAAPLESFEDKREDSDGQNGSCHVAVLCRAKSGYSAVEFSAFGF
jgi:hypothetical protein